jgi:hypothetical protein
LRLALKRTPVTFFFLGTQVQDGEGKMIVIAVGSATYQESLLAEKPKVEGEGALELKL